MAYYATVTNAVREGSRITIQYEIRDNSTTPHTMIRTASAGFEMLPIDATAADGKLLMAAQRQAYLRTQVAELFQSQLKRLRAADADAGVVLANIIGFTVP